jgi:large subunit ribosomal protein L17
VSPGIYADAPKIITLGKRGDIPAHRRASSFLLNPALVPKLFTTFAERYALRPGGYTRVHKYGRRQGDNAPAAVLELVDGPQDVRFALTARAVGRETLALKLGESTLRRSIREGVPEVQAVVDKELDVHYKRKGWLNGTTRLNMQKVLRFRGEGAKEELVQQAKEHAVSVFPAVSLLPGSRLCPHPGPAPRQADGLPQHRQI